MIDVDEVELISIDDALVIVHPKKVLKEFYSKDNGNLAKKYKLFIGNRYSHDSRKLSAMVRRGLMEPIEKYVSMGSSTAYYTKWWVLKKVRDMKVVDWIKEFELV